MKSKTIVLDIGAGCFKLGMAGSTLTPALVEPSVVGVARSKAADDSNGSCVAPKDHPLLFGDEAIKAQEMNQVSCRYPIDDLGGIADWPAFQMLLFYIFEKLGIEDLQRYNLLIPRPHSFSKQDMDRFVGFLFDEIGVGRITMHDQAALVLYTQDIETGVVVEAGEGQIRIIPVYQGHAIPKLDKNFPIGGRALSKYLIKLLRLRGYHLDLKDNRETARKLKEALCYVAMDPEEERKLAEETTILLDAFSLSDGSSITIGRERFEAPEALFQPSMLDVEGSGIADLLFDVIQQADIDCRVDLYENIILSGGTSAVPGFKERLQSRLEERHLADVLQGDKSRLKGDWKIQVKSPKTHSCLVFEGAALFADAIQDNAQYWVSRQEYHEHGVDAVLDKCRVF
jgi:actin-related protein 2